MNHACHRQVARGPGAEVWGDLVALLVFKTSVGLNKVPGVFDSHPPPPISRSMFKRVPQPPINPALRAREGRDFWPAFVVAVAGALLGLCGAGHQTSVNTVGGNAASEVQLVKAFSCGGLQYPNQAAPPPPKLDGVANPGEALDRWAKEQANFKPPTWKLRVDAAAKTPCPT